MSGIGVLSNPRSRKNRKNPRLTRRLGYLLGEKGDLQAPTDLDALAQVASRFRERDIDILCVNGGDGTLHTALTAMVGAYGDHPLPKVAVLKGGTMNTVAHGLGIRGSASEILHYVVRCYHAEEPMPTARRWLMAIDDQQYGFMFGNGLVARFLEAYYEGSEPSPTKALLLLARGAASVVVRGRLARWLSEPFYGTAEVDGHTWPLERWMSVAAGTVDDLGVGFRPFYKAPRHPGRLHALGLGCRPWDVVRNLPRIYRAQPIAAEGVFERVGTELIIRSDEPINYMIDGDFHRGGQTLTVRTGPPVDIICPEL